MALIRGARLSNPDNAKLGFIVAVINANYIAGLDGRANPFKMSAAFAQIFCAGYFEEGMAFASGAPELDAETKFSTWVSPSTHTKGSLYRSVIFSECLDRNRLDYLDQVTEVTDCLVRRWSRDRSTDAANSYAGIRFVSRNWRSSCLSMGSKWQEIRAAAT